MRSSAPTLDIVGAFGNKAALALPPARRFAILTYMDARLNPAKYAGLAEGDAHAIRNAAGRATGDAIRSLVVISYKLLGTRVWFVIQHSDCGMQLFTDEIMDNLLQSSLTTAVITKQGWQDIGKDVGSGFGKIVKWHRFTKLEQSVIDDVLQIRNHPLVPRSIPVYGYLYDVKTGRLSEVLTPDAARRTVEEDAEELLCSG